jgi:hypothetical protein
MTFNPPTFHPGGRRFAEKYRAPPRSDMIVAACCIVAACLAARISSKRAGVASVQDKFDLLTAKARGHLA